MRVQCVGKLQGYNMNYDEMIIALKNGNIITSTAFKCERKFYINPNNENEFCINNDIDNYINIENLEAYKDDQRNDWIIVNA